MGKKKLATKKKAGAPKFTVKDNGTVVCELTSSEGTLSTFGTDDSDAVKILLAQLMLPIRDFDTLMINGVVSMLTGINPQNGLEGMLAVQMVTAHNLAMSMAGRAMIKGQTAEGVNDNISQATRLMKVFVSQTEALAKLRGNTKTVTIKHVNVNAGGQAIIGDVHHGVSDGKK